MGTLELSKQQIAAARKRGKETELKEPSAISVRYNPLARELNLRLRDGRWLSVNVDLIEGLKDADDADLSQVELTPAGTGLHWEALGADILVSSLLQEIYGTKSWMAGLGQQGGKATTEAKAKAARANGKKGGRPHKLTKNASHQVMLELPPALYKKIRNEAANKGVSVSDYLLTLLIRRSG